MKPLILGVAGLRVSAAESALFRIADPAGFILFGRNCHDAAQIRALTSALRDAAGRDVPVLVDQEGGRVVRLRGADWPVFPAAERFAASYDRAPVTAITAARLNGQAMGLLLRDLGINVNCLPVLDVRHPATDASIADRCLGAAPLQIAALGKALLDGMRDAGVAGVVKHIPGQGRATSDSHLDAPVVSVDRAALEIDFAPFRSLNTASMAMVAHVIFAAIDAAACASQSAIVVREIIRGAIGFSGLLMSDDIGMAALRGTMAARTQAVLGAGVELVLHGSGDLGEMTEIADSCDAMPAAMQQRLAAALVPAPAAPTADLARLLGQRDALLAA